MVVLAALAASLLQPAFAAAPPASLDAPVWRQATHQRFENTDVFLLEDGKFVYVAFDAAKREKSGDDVALYLWSDKAAYAFTVDANGVSAAKCSIGEPPAWTAQMKDAGDGYRVMMRLPQALFRGGGQSRWLVQFAREMPESRVSYTWPASGGGAGNVLYASAFETGAPGAFRPATAAHPQPTVAPAGQAQNLWPSDNSPLGAPAIPADAQGVAVAQSRDNVHVAGVEAKSSDGTVQNAQSLAWTSSDGRASAGVQRIASSNSSAHDVAQALSFAFDNLQNVRVSAGVAADRGTNVGDPAAANYSFYDFLLYGESSNFEMRWNSAGPQYNATGDGAPAPGTTGYTLTASQKFGSVSVNANADRYRDDLGNLADADAGATISAALNSAFTFDVDAAANAATQYTTLPYSQTGASLRYAAGSNQAKISYNQDDYDGGIARELALSGGFSVPLLGTLQLAHSERTTIGSLALQEANSSSSAALQHALKNGSVSLGYQYAAGAANVTFSFEDRLPLGLLRATYYNPNTRFSTPNFTLKLIAL